MSIIDTIKRYKVQYTKNNVYNIHKNTNRIVLRILELFTLYIIVSSIGTVLGGCPARKMTK